MVEIIRSNKRYLAVEAHSGRTVATAHTREAAARRARALGYVVES